MITPAMFAKALAEAIVKQAPEADNLGDGASLYLGEGTALDIFQLAEDILPKLDDGSPPDADFEEAYQNWRSHGTWHLERKAPPSNHGLAAILGAADEGSA